MFLDRLRPNIKFVLLGPFVLMVCQKKKYGYQDVYWKVCWRKIHTQFVFSCITPHSEGKHEKKDRRSNMNSSNSEYETVSEQMFCPRIFLWIVCNWPESGLTAFEEYISKEILAAGLDLRSCKAIRGRG